MDPHAVIHTGPVHLHGQKQGYVAKGGLPKHEIFDATGKVIFRQNGNGSICSLGTCDGPVVLGQETWHGWWEDGPSHIDMTPYFTETQITGPINPYVGWRLRGMLWSGYADALYGATPTDPENVRQLGTLVPVYGGFQSTADGWALAPQGGHQYLRLDGRWLWYATYDIFCDINFQVELMHSDPDPRPPFNDPFGHGPSVIEGDAYHPAFTAAILTDQDTWRGFPAWRYPNRPT